MCMSECRFVCSDHVCNHLKQVQKLPAFIAPWQSHQHSLQTPPLRTPSSLTLHPHHCYGNHNCRKRNHLRKKKKKNLRQWNIWDVRACCAKRQANHFTPLSTVSERDTATISCKPSLSDHLSFSLSLRWQSCSIGCGLCDKWKWFVSIPYYRLFSVCIHYSLCVHVSSRLFQCFLCLYVGSHICLSHLSIHLSFYM